jgi:ABC-2 type transport system ATP-binding protein
MTHSFPTRLSDGAFAVSTNGLRKQYGKRVILRDLDLQVPVGAVYLLAGPNGAGKSTVFKALLDLVRTDAGSATVLQMNVRSQGAHVRANVGYVPEHTNWGYGWMRVDDLLQHHARYFVAWDTEYATQLARTFRLPLARRFEALSKGEKRCVQLTMALAHRPPLLLLDEPTDGIDPVMRDEVLGVLVDHLAVTATTTILSTHHLEEVERLVDHVGILDHGMLRLQLSVETLQTSLADYRVVLPDEWPGVPSLDGTVFRRVTTPREALWTVWGDQATIVEQLTRAHATMREVTTLPFADAIACLIKSQREEQ